RRSHGPAAPFPASSPSTTPRGAATSPPGRSRSCSPRRSARPSGRCGSPATTQPTTKGHQILMLCHAYASTEDAENAIERLVAAGVPAAGIQLITGDAVNDSRDAPIGAFAGTTAAGAETVGSFAG